MGDGVLRQKKLLSKLSWINRMQTLKKWIMSRLEQLTFSKSIGRDTDFQWIFQGWDGVEADRQGIELNYIYLKDLDPALNYYTPLIATSESKMAKDKEMVKSFMKATSKGYQFAIEEPEEAADILIKNVPEINAELVKDSQVWLSEQYQGDAKQWGMQEEKVGKDMRIGCMNES